MLADGHNSGLRLFYFGRRLDPSQSLPSGFVSVYKRSDPVKSGDFKRMGNDKNLALNGQQISFIKRLNLLVWGNCKERRESRVLEIELN